MGLFRDYFKKKLGFILIQSPGPLSQGAFGGADALDGARDDALWLRKQFLPLLCDDVFLENFARSRGVVRAALEPEAHYIGRLRYAYNWFIMGGKDAGMINALLNYFDLTEVVITNLRDEDPEKWAEFRVLLNGIKGELLTKLDQVEWAINEAKPARSKFAGYNLRITFPQAVDYLGVGIIAGHDVTLYPFGAGEMETQTTANEMPVVLSGHHVTIYPLGS